MNLSPSNHAHALARLTEQQWCVACLCAAWCDVCDEFRPIFDELADRYPEALLLWIDIEDEADVVGSFDVENFPTLLIQQGSNVAFFGPVEPGLGGLTRLISAFFAAAPQLRDSVPACEAPTVSDKAPGTRPDLRQALKQWVVDRE